MNKQPWVVVGHGSEFTKSDPIRYYLLKLAFESADSVICVSNFTKKLMESNGISTKNVSVINNGADDNVFKAVDEGSARLIKRKLGLENKFVLLTVGNVTERKGQEFIIRALPYIKKEIPEIIFVMVGLPTLKESLMLLAKELDVEHHIKFAGKVEQNDLVENYQAADLFLMTSICTNTGDVEGFGIAVIEAALCGKPAIVSANSGLEEAVLNGMTGIVVPAQDPKAVARAVILLFKDKNLIMSMGEKAHERAVADFTWKQCANKYIHVIKNLVN